MPASFRAHAIEIFNKRVGDNSEFRLRSVGRPGREIVTPPTDARMAEVIEAFAATPNPKPVYELLDINGEQMFRTVYPTVAQEQSCVSCHNALQPGNTQWHLNDVMGAFVIVTGLSSEVAQTLVTLGVDLSKLNTVGDLQGGIEEAERLLGYKVIRPEQTAATMSPA